MGTGTSAKTNGTAGTHSKEHRKKETAALPGDDMHLLG